MAFDMLALNRWKDGERGVCGMEREEVVHLVGKAIIQPLPGVRAAGRVNMPRGPEGEKRPADVIGAAFMVAQIATG